MQINRHNYETFFLLYVDNELSAADRKAVDVFVQKNPDLLMELQMLQQTVVQADDIVLDKKDWLYREEEISALQENLLLYADDELLPADKKLIEALLATDKMSIAEWSVLQQTKLQPDTTIVFADKQSLYRTEGARVIGIKWWRVAAAAVLLGFALWAGVSVYKNNFNTVAGKDGLVNNNKIKNTQPKKTTSVNEVPAEIQPTEKATPENNVIAVDQKTPADKKMGVSKKNEEINNKQDNKITKENIVKQTNSINKSDNNLPKPYFEKINNTTSNQTVVASVIPENNNISKVSGNNTEAVRTNPKENPNNSIVNNLNKNKTDQSTAAIPVANKKTTDENNNIRYLNVDDDKEKRTALSGFLRKAKRMIERTTNIKTGDGIKVAGFEIALK
jgi:hypothetical protein